MPHDTLINQYEAGSAMLGSAIAGLSHAQRVSFPVPGTWSIQQIVIHLADSDLVATDRMKRIIAEDKPPLLIGYDETAFSKHLAYDDQSTDDAVSLFELNRRQMARILRTLPLDVFAKFGIHNEHGKLTLLQMVEAYIRHLDHHLKFVRQKREMVERAG